MADESAPGFRRRIGAFSDRAALLAGAPLLIMALAGCDRAAPGFGVARGIYREQSIATCSDGMRLAGASREVSDRICGCGVDRFIAGRPDAQLEALNEEEQRQGLDLAVRYCLAHAPDLGPPRPDLPAAPSDVDVAPLPAPGPAEETVPNLNQSGAGNERPAGRARRETEAAPAEVESEAGNETAAPRWQLSPPR